MPILLRLLSREGEHLTPRRGVHLAGTYALAVASAFALLGVAAALSGRNLQAALQSPWVLGGHQGPLALQGRLDEARHLRLLRVRLVDRDQPVVRSTIRAFSTERSSRRSDKPWQPD